MEFVVPPQGLRLTLIGAIIGTIAALIATRYVRSLLPEVQASGPGTVAGVAATVMLVALMASYIPARRAATIDPVVALRAE